MNKEHSPNNHNLYVINTGVCADCGGTTIIDAPAINLSQSPDPSVLTLQEEVERLKGLVWKAWHQATENCEAENGYTDDGQTFVSREQFQQLNKL